MCAAYTAPPAALQSLDMPSSCQPGVGQLLSMVGGRGYSLPCVLIYRSVRYVMPCLVQLVVPTRCFDVMVLCTCLQAQHAWLLMHLLLWVVQLMSIQMWWLCLLPLGFAEPDTVCRLLVAWVGFGEALKTHTLSLCVHLQMNPVDSTRGLRLTGLACAFWLCQSDPATTYTAPYPRLLVCSLY
jgi:hypothetical protein